MNRRDFVKLTAAAAAGAALPSVTRAAESSFPPGFLWGVASAAAQVESRDGRGRSNWDVFADTSGRILDGSSNARLTEFETRYPEELALLSKAGVNAFRFSFAWPRVQPEGPGAPSAAGLDVYARLLDALQERGMEPCATLFHWDTPLWAGDLRQREIALRMADYAEIVTAKFGDRIKHWLALNEPNTVSVLGYANGWNAPGYASPKAYAAAVHHLNLAQGLMIAAARATLPKGSRISTTINVQPVRPETESAADKEAARRLDEMWNGAFLNPLFGKPYPETVAKAVEPYVQAGDLETIAAKPEFLGVNYYYRYYTKADPASPLGFTHTEGPADLPRTSYGHVEADGLTETLLRVHRECGAPEIYITETGFSLEDAAPTNGVVEDPLRIKYLESYLQAAAKAIAEGARLKGLFYWGSTDNWEWAQGFAKTFGLIQINRETQARTPKRSLEYYGKCARMNGIAKVG